MDFNEMMKTWENTIIRPSETIKIELDNKKGMKEGAIAYIITAVITILFTIAIAASTGTSSFAYAFYIVILPLLAFIITVILPIIGYGLVHLMAKGLGGKGDFSKLYYLTSTFTPILMIVSIGMLILLPNIFGGLAIAIISIYNLFLTTKVLRQMHGFGWLNALLLCVVPMIICIGLLLVGAILLQSNMPNFDMTHR